MWPNPHWHQPQQPTVGSKHFLSGSKPKLTILKVAQKTGWLEVTHVPFLNPDLITQLMGHSNEAPVIIDGQETTALIDLGAQLSSKSSQFCEELALWIQSLGQLFELEGTGGAAIPLPWVHGGQPPEIGIANYNKGLLLLVIPTMTYSEMVPVMVGSKIIDKTLSLMTKGELAKATMTWRQGHFGAFMAGPLQLSHTSFNKSGVEEEVSHPSQSSGPVEVRKFCFNDIRGLVCTTWNVTIPPFGTVSVHANSSVKGHCMWVHALTEPVPVSQLPAAVVPMAT